MLPVTSKNSFEHQPSFPSALNTSADSPVFTILHRGSKNNSIQAVGPSVQPFQHHAIPNSSPECVFSETQPLPGSVDVLVSYNVHVLVHILVRYTIFVRIIAAHSTCAKNKRAALE